MEDHLKVNPRVLLGWLANVLEQGESIDVAEWNKAIRALAATSPSG
jgi:hypothetical protein